MLASFIFPATSPFNSLAAVVHGSGRRPRGLAAPSYLWRLTQRQKIPTSGHWTDEWESPTRLLTSLFILAETLQESLGEECEAVRGVGGRGGAGRIPWFNSQHSHKDMESQTGQDGKVYVDHRIVLRKGFKAFFFPFFN